MILKIFKILKTLKCLPGKGFGVGFAMIVKIKCHDFLRTEASQLENLKTLQEFVILDIYTFKKLIVLCLKTSKGR